MPLSRKKGSKGSRAKKKSPPKTPKAYLVRPFRFLLLDNFRLIGSHKKMYLKFTLLYGAFYFILVRALTNLDVNSVSDVIDAILGERVNELVNSLALTTAILGVSVQLDQTSGLYALMLFLVFSMALLWMLRHIYANRKTTLKQAFYEGMAPLVPFAVLMALVGIQMIPFSIGSFVLGQALADNLIVNSFEAVIVFSVFLAGLLLSGYWIVGTIFALYISTIPEMTPLQALRTSKDVLKGRRFMALQRALLFGLFSIITGFLFLLAVVSLLPAAAFVAATLLTVIALPWVHSFFYNFYRSLIDG